MKKNMSGFMLYKEKVECYGAVKTIADKINNRDADMMSHVIMSVFKVASAEANIPWSPPTSPPSSKCANTLCDMIFTMNSTLVLYLLLGFQS